jgi:recombination protein RecR
MGQEIEKLINLFSSLPTIGRKTAIRIVLQLLSRKKSLIPAFVESFEEVAEKVKHCEVCFNIDVVNPCNICNSDKRDKDILCIVENVEDLWAIEQGNNYRGKYHILGGVLSAVKGVTPADLNISSLERRLDGSIEEAIIAINAGLDGQTTGYFLSDILQDKVKKITKLGHGLPLGGEIGYLDEGTINAAFEYRRAV